MLCSKEFCYHGSTYHIKYGNLEPRQGKDLDKDPDNELLAVYASDQPSISITMSMLRLDGVKHSRLKSNTFPHGIIYSGEPDLNQKIYLYECKQSYFKQQNKPRQWVSLKNVPIEICYILSPKDYQSYLIYDHSG